MTGARVRVLAALLVLAAGCDEVVQSGETVVADNGGSIWAFNTPNAVEVQPGGTLVVANANLFGLGKRIDTLPPGQFPLPGAAIQSNGGTIVIQKGRIAGGNILLEIDPSTIPPRLLGLPSALAPALAALDSVVEIDGGTLIASTVIGQPNPYFPLATVAVSRGQLRIRGGELLLGGMAPSPAPFLGNSLVASDSDVEISGGDFEGVVEFFDSRATITGGRFAGGIEIPTVVALEDGGARQSIASSTLPKPCYEIRGGTIPSIFRTS